MLGASFETTTLFLAATFLGGFVAGVAGFAFGLIAAAIWLHIISPVQTTLLIVAYALLIQGVATWKLRHALDLRRLLPFLIGGAAGIPLGAAALRWLAPNHLRIATGLVIVLFSLYSLLRPKLGPFRGGFVPDGLVGAVSGALAASTGLGGLPTTIWSTVRGWSKDEQRAVFQPVGGAIFLMTALWLGGGGFVDAATVRLFLLGLPPLLIGTWLGLKLYARLDEAAFRKVVLFLLLLSGASLVL